MRTPYSDDGTWEYDPTTGGYVQTGVPASLSTDSNGNTVLVGAGGVAKDRFPLPLNPNGLDWLTDTISGFDIYDQGFVKRPTIFFDPSSTNAARLGTFNSPYTTREDLVKRVKGNMTGQVLGFKRGSTFSVGQTGFELTVYGSATDPFYIVPYGDAEALPVISGFVNVPAGRWSLHSGSIYKVDLDDLVTDGLLNSTSAGAMDVFQSGVRINGQKFLANVTQPGEAFYDTSTHVLYAWLWDSEVPTTQCKINAPNHALHLKYADVATFTGGIILAGIHATGSAGSNIAISAEGTSAITACSTIGVYGCKSDFAGAANSGFGNAGFSLFGPSSSVLMEGLIVKGNYANDTLNNSYEFAYVNGNIVEHNRGEKHVGNLLELWASCKNGTYRYNTGTGRIDTAINTDFAFVSCGGIWVTDFVDSAANTPDLDGAANGGNLFAFNVDRNTQNGIRIQSGVGNKVHHNTMLGNSSAFEFGRYSQCSAAGTRVMSLEASNNLFQNDDSLGAVSGGGFVYSGTAITNQSSKTVTCTITGNGNRYLRRGHATNDGSVRVTNSGATTWYVGQAQQTAYRAAISGFDLVGYLGDQLVGDSFDTDGSPLAGNTTVIGVGVTGLTTIGTQDVVGRPYDSTVAGNVGAFQE